MNIEILMKQDIAGEITDDQFDDELWLALCERITDIQSLAELPVPVKTYYASRYVEWEVGNGGFAQAALNVPEWLEPSAQAFEVLGKPKIAKLIRQALQIYAKEESPLPDVKPGAEPELSDWFYENEFNKLDEQIESVDFWSDSTRLAYVRNNRQAFIEAIIG